MVRVRFKNGETIEIQNDLVSKRGLFELMKGKGAIWISEYTFNRDDVLWMYTDNGKDD